MDKANIGDGDMKVENLLYCLQSLAASDPEDAIDGCYTVVFEDEHSCEKRMDVHVSDIAMDAYSTISHIKDELDELSKRFTALIQQNSALAADNERLTEELIRACAELSGIKKQEPIYAFRRKGLDPFLTCSIERFEELSEKDIFETKVFYEEPVHQHSFTISGIGTFYADSELEITYLERLHGVGGKANLKEVT